MNTLLSFLLVLIGGGLGSLARWLVGNAVGERYTGSFPLGTFVINVSGAFAMGVLSTLFVVDWRDRYGSTLTALVLTGVLGGYTTFSSYQLDAVSLYETGERGVAAWYWAGSIVAGLVAAALGAALARVFK